MDAGADNEILGTHAELAVQLDAWAGVLDLDEVFRRHPGLSCVVVHTEQGPSVVERSWFEAWVTGRLGYGRAVHARTRLGDLRLPASLILTADTTVEAAALAIIDGDGRVPVGHIGVLLPDRVIGTVRTTTIFSGLYQRYAFQAVHDPLTGLYNRMFLTRHLRSGPLEATAALYVDLDRFKDVNDRYGHAAGDQVLVAFAQRLCALAGRDDLVIRLGGDEFVLLLARGEDPYLTRSVAERVVAEAARPFLVTLEPSAPETAPTVVTVQLGASVGVATAGGGRHPGRSPDQILSEADLAMYQAKSMGRGRHYHYDEQLLTGPQAPAQAYPRHDLERRLRDALARGELELHYQPQLEPASGMVTGAEALARWHDPDLGQVPPQDFIAVAEDSGLIVDLGRWALNRACHDAVGWPAVGGGDAPSVSVNVSAVQLAQRSFLDDVMAALSGSGLPPRRLCLEITETAAIADLAETARCLTELRGIGISVALDDFGTGHSSLTMLRRLPVGVVKIDKSFAGRITDDPADATLVRLVTEAAHALGLRVCAEGIETPEQAAQLAAIGCDLVQGRLVSDALPGPAALASWLYLQAAVAGGRPPAPQPQVPDELVVVADEQGRITHVGPAVVDLLGWRPADLTGTAVLDLIHPQERDRVRASALQEDGQPGGVVHRFQHADGTYRWLRYQVRRVAAGECGRWQYLLVCRLVTETTSTAAHLAGLRSHLHTIGITEGRRTAYVPASRSHPATDGHH